MSSDAITKTFTVFSGSPEGVTTTQTTRTLQPDECLVRITHSGLCGTDCYVKHKTQGLGHEGVGVIEAVGSAVPEGTHKVGDVVGWGYIHRTCGHCTSCLRGEDAFCDERQMYQFYDLDQGSLGEYGCWHWKFLFKIPEGLSPADAAPLQCGGATVFTPLFSHGVKSTDVVGVIGIGGLGHLAVMFAAKMGCKVVVLSGTESKREESMKMGASEFYVMSDLKSGKVKMQTKVNHLLVTSSRQPDWALCMDFMEKEGTIYPLGLSSGDLSIPYAPLLIYGLKVVGCCVASRLVHTEMLKFAARHKIKPIIEEFPMTVEGINAAYDKLENGTIRYRAVMTNEKE